MPDLPLDLVRTLLTVVDEGTFDAAARALHVTPSAVSQRIKALEQRAGRVLLLRSKPVRLTDSGTVVVRFGRQLARLEHDTRAELGMAETGEPTPLPIAVNADSLATWFLPALSTLPDRFRVCFELHREDEFHTTELLRQGRVMAAVTSSPDPVQGCTVRRLGRMRYRPMASPEFVGRWLSGGPLGQLLADAPVVLFDRKDELQDRFLRKLRRRAGLSPIRHYVPASEAFVAAVVGGLGWGMVPEEQAAPLPADALVILDPDRWVDVPLFWQQWKLDSPALAALADSVVRTATAALTPTTKPTERR